MWQVELADPFKEWLLQQEDSLKKRIAAALLNLQHYGPMFHAPMPIPSPVRAITI